MKDTILERYPRTTVFYKSFSYMCSIHYFYVELQPFLKQEDRSYKYSDTYNGGSWKIMKSLVEIDEMKVMNNAKNRNLYRLCKMVSAWKNKYGISMGGLLILTYPILCLSVAIWILIH
ncbi:SMODS domain-containing nucleotidyltransferase [Acinetobacter seifertii]|uniref:SMODS domain-containing nucleotidyltransferase n=1 Tax=Acinetobacter seifertii TaxID=1530123 RepID=UPI003862643E